ncbi:MAG TPA: hypothetical protein PLG36_02795 [Trueperaceae bacterium]|jgi:hypothetical protein|nr:hypothetical protein [Trueperaceae bacterium]
MMFGYSHMLHAYAEERTARLQRAVAMERMVTRLRRAARWLKK